MREEKYDKIITRHTENILMAIVSPSLSIIAVNINELNSLIKKHRVAE